MELWSETYGIADMDLCADLTTAHMRDDKPKSVWVYDTWQFLNEINYSTETSEVIRQQIDDEIAVIVLQTRIYAIDGYIDQKELFSLVYIRRKVVD